MFKSPLPMLDLTRDTPAAATIELSDGIRLTGEPAASVGQAVHNVFEAWHNTKLVLPFGQHITPLATDTLALCRVFRRLIERDDELGAIILGWPGQLDEDRTIEAVHNVIAQVPYVISAAELVLNRTRLHATDIHAGGMTAHPLTGFAERTTFMALAWSKQALTQLGLPHAITETFVVNLPLKPEETFEGFVPGWPSEQAYRWWEDRERRLRHYINTLARIAKDGRQRKARLPEMSDATWRRLDCLVSRQMDRARAEFVSRSHP